MSGRGAGASTGTPRRSRTNALTVLGTAGATLALAGTAWYWYSQWAGSNSTSGGGQRGAGGTATTDAAGDNASASSSGHWPVDPKSLSRRPTLSLVLPAHSLPLAQSSLLQSHVLTIYRSLAALYNIHLIYHCGSDGGNAAEEEALPHSFLRQLEAIPGADSRRLLANSTPRGAWAVARALACDAHVQLVFTASADADDDVGVIEHGTEEQMGNEKADRNAQQGTPLKSTQGTLLHTAEDSAAAAATALTLVRRNGKCKLFVLWVLPMVHEQQPHRQQGRQRQRQRRQKGDRSDADSWASSSVTSSSSRLPSSSSSSSSSTLFPSSHASASGTESARLCSHTVTRTSTSAHVDKLIHLLLNRPIQGQSAGSGAAGDGSQGTNNKGRAPTTASASASASASAPKTDGTDATGAGAGATIRILDYRRPPTASSTSKRVSPPNVLLPPSRSRGGGDQESTDARSSVSHNDNDDDASGDDSSDVSSDDVSSRDTEEEKARTTRETKQRAETAQAIRAGLGRLRDFRSGWK